MDCGVAWPDYLEALSSRRASTEADSDQAIQKSVTAPTAEVRMSSCAAELQAARNTSPPSPRTNFSATATQPLC